MKFDINIWYHYRNKASNIADTLRPLYDALGIPRFEKDHIERNISYITCILDESSDYLDKCGLTLPSPLWNYNAKDPKTHASSKYFIYKDRMSKNAIRSYGTEFMTG